MLHICAGRVRDELMPPIVQIQVSRALGDCAVVALSMYLGRPYEDVFAAAASITKNILFHKTGMFYTQIHQTAAIFGTTLHTTKLAKTYDLDSICGILGLRATPTRNQHVVLIKAGLVFEADGTVWEVDTYLKHTKYKPLCLTTSEDEEKECPTS